MSLVAVGFHLMLGALGAFAGTVPFGPINLSVVDAAIKKGWSPAIKMSVSAALVEIAQAFLAYHFGMLVTRSLDDHPGLKLGVYGAFVLIGVAFMLKKPATRAQKAGKFQLSDYGRGALVAILNPQAIPFWVFVFTYYEAKEWLNHGFWLMVVFLFGVSIGKFACLVLFALLGDLIAKRASAISTWMNKILGLVFITIGMVQIIKFLMS